MFDSKLIQGLLIAACVFLAVGILTTALEIQDYKNPQAPQTGAPAPVEPAEDDTEPEAETPVESETPVDTTDGTE